MSLRRVLCAFISLALGACATPSHAPDGKRAPVSTAKVAPAAHRPDASASYHFMLGYQAELVQDTDRAIQEYQAALKTDPTSHSVNARLASLYFHWAMRLRLFVMQMTRPRDPSRMAPCSRRWQEFLPAWGKETVR